MVDAVRCAVEIQHALKVKNAELPEHRQDAVSHRHQPGRCDRRRRAALRRWGQHRRATGKLSDPGGICISGTVYDHVENKLALNYEYQGEQTVKNIAKPVRTYRVVMDEAAAALAEQAVLRQAQHRSPDEAQRNLGNTPGPGLRSAPSRLLPVPAMGHVAGLLLIAAAIVTVWYISRSPLSPQSSALSPDAAPAALPLPDKPSIVVLPFDNMSKDPAQDYFSNGITEVLTSDLSRISSLFVIARNTAFTYQGKAVNIQAVGKELGVRYVLEGSVQKAGEQIRIVTQLIDTTTGGHLWSQRYDRPLQDLFALQDEIVQKIVTTLKLQLTLQEQGYVVRKHTDNLEAYDAFLRGLEYHLPLHERGQCPGDGSCLRKPLRWTHSMRRRTRCWVRPTG